MLERSEAKVSCCVLRGASRSNAARLLGYTDNDPILLDRILPDNRFFTITMTITLYDSHLKWFETYFWKPISKGLPSSSAELRHKLLVPSTFLLVRLRRTYYSQLS